MKESATYGYVRATRWTQSKQAQLAELRAYGHGSDIKIITEDDIGSLRLREINLRALDTLVITEPGVLGETAAEMMENIEHIGSLHPKVNCLSIGLIKLDQNAILMVRMFEAGVAANKAGSLVAARSSIVKKPQAKLTGEMMERALKEWHGPRKDEDIAQEFGVSVRTLYRTLKERGPRRAARKKQ